MPGYALFQENILNFLGLSNGFSMYHWSNIVETTFSGKGFNPSVPITISEIIKSKTQKSKNLRGATLAPPSRKYVCSGGEGVIQKRMKVY